MKKLFAVLCFLSSVLLVSAQDPRLYSLSTTNVVLTGTTNSPGVTIACAEYANAGIQISCNSTASATAAVIFRFAKSLDSTTYESTPEFPLTVTLSGTNIITLVTNLSIPSGATLKLGTIEAPTALASNISVKVHFKSVRVRSR